MQANRFVLALAIAAIVIHPCDLEAGEREEGPKEFLGKVLPTNLHHQDPHSIRDLFVEDVPGTKSYWLGPWVETVAVNGVDRFYIIKGSNRFYVNAGSPGDSNGKTFPSSTGIHDFYGPFEGKPGDHFKLPAERDGVDLSATAPESDFEVCASEKILFEDSMAENWQENWFLDGKNATLEHRDGGLAFVTTASKVDKRLDRAAFDAQHAVLWTRQEFDGAIRISYTYRMLPECSWQKLIYVQAQGIGEPPYVKDIHAWKELRDVSVMSQYFNHMDLIGLSLRDQIRCKRYPWSDVKRKAELESEFLPRAENKGLPIGRDLHVMVEKWKDSISLRIKDIETGEHAVNHSWDLSDENVIKNREPKWIERGRIGIRLMGGHKILMREFKVEQLQENR